MTAEELRRAAVALFGERGWMSRLAEALGVDRSTVSRWFSGLPVPGPVAAAVTAWLRLQVLTGETPVSGQAPSGDGGVWLAVIAPVDGSEPPATARLRRSPGGRLLIWRGLVLQPLTRPQTDATHFDIESGRRYRLVDAPPDAAAVGDDESD